MGQKVHPIGFRVGVSRPWESMWYQEKKNYVTCLHEDLKIRQYLKKNYKDAGISRVIIERAEGIMKLYVHAARPGHIVGRSNAKIPQLLHALSKFTSVDVQPFIMEVAKADLEAQLVAESIAQQLEKRVSFRRAMKKALKATMAAKAEGIRISCSGRLGGAEMARNEWLREGCIPLHTLRANIDYGFAEGLTTYGIIGVKVWIYKGEVVSEG